MDKKFDVENVLSTTINKWISLQQNIDIVSNLDEEIELVIKAVTNKEMSEADLGGLKALRGFYYQYLVAVFYMVEMNNENRWDIIAFEVLDDITLINVKNATIRYVQVKTKREDSEVRTFKIKNDLAKRDNGLNSWVDKILKSHEKADEQYSDYTVEYELAINDKVESSIAPYKLNTSYDMKDLDNTDGLFKALKKKVTTKDELDQSWEDENILKDRLKKFCVKSFDKSDLLRLCITQKLASEMVKKEDEIEYCKAVAAYVVKELMHRITLRTCDDSKNTKNDELIFTKEEIKGWIEYGIEVGRREIGIINQRVNKREYFSGMFCELRRKFKEEWISGSSDILIEHLDWIEHEFSNEDEKDPYFYNKFISRLFNFENDAYSCITKSPDEANRILNALEYLVVLHVMQTDNHMILNESKFIFKKGCNLSNQAQNFSICDMKGKYSFEDSQQIIVMKANGCSASKSLEHSYFCIVNDFISGSGTLSELFGDTQNIPELNEKIGDTPTLIDSFKRIRFLKGDEKMRSYINTVKNREMEITNKRCKEVFEKLMSS